MSDDRIWERDLDMGMLRARYEDDALGIALVDYTERLQNVCASLSRSLKRKVNDLSTANSIIDRLKNQIEKFDETKTEMRHEIERLRQQTHALENQAVIRQNLIEDLALRLHEAGVFNLRSDIPGLARKVGLLGADVVQEQFIGVKEEK